MRASVIACLLLIGLLGLGLRAQMRHGQACVFAGNPDDGRPKAPRPPEAPKPPAVVRPAPVPTAPLWKADVTSDPKTTPAAARQDALKAAARKLGEYMQEKYPGYRWDPTSRFLIDHRLVDEGKDVPIELKEIADAPLMFNHTLTIELREPQLSLLLQEDRRERSVERLWQAGRVLGGLIVMLLAIVGYVRLDDWTKGYLSLPLKLAALAVAIAGPVVLWLLV